MDLQQLRDELTRRGISFAANAGVANLEAKLAEAIAKEKELTGETLPQDPEGKSSPGPETPAAPAAVASTAPAAEVPDAISEVEIIAKTQAGLTREQAIEVITNQRAHDKALGL